MYNADIATEGTDDVSTQLFLVASDIFPHNIIVFKKKIESFFFHIIVLGKKSLCLPMI